MARNFLWRNSSALKPRSLVFAGLMMMTCTSLAQEPSETVPAPQLPSGPLKLDTMARITLILSPTIKTQFFQTDVAKSGVQAAAGAFDINTTTTLTRRQSRLIGPGIGDNDHPYDLNVSLNKAFRTGISSSFSVSLMREEPEKLNPVTTSNNSTISFNVTVPLLRGRGYTGSTATVGETTAQLGGEAAVQSYYDTISKTLLAAIIAYWDYKAAVESLKAYQVSQQRVVEWSDEASKAVKASGKAQTLVEKYAPQIARLKAFMAEQARKVNDATDQVNQKKVALATAMGLPAEQVDKIGDPDEKFPTDWNNEAARFDQAHAMQKWVTTALERRFDVKAAKLNEQSAAVSLAKARQDLLPGLDLGFASNVNGTRSGNAFGDYTGSLNSSGENRGTDLGVTLTLSYALGNNTAHGVLGSANATYQLNVSQLNEVIRGARLEVGQSVSTLAGTLQSVKLAQQAAQGYGPVLTKYKSSHPDLVSDPRTLFDLMDIEKDSIATTIQFYNSLLELAKTITTVRHQTGVLIEVDPATGHGSLKDITKFPDL